MLFRAFHRVRMFASNSDWITCECYDCVTDGLAIYFSCTHITYINNFIKQCFCRSILEEYKKQQLTEEREQTARDTRGQLMDQVQQGQNIAKSQ